MLKKIGHEPSGDQIVKSQEMSVFYHARLLDKFKQLDSSQWTKLYSTYSLQFFFFKLNAR